MFVRTERRDRRLKFDPILGCSLSQDGPVQPTQSDQLKFYGLYKQATIGDVNTSRPGMMGEYGARIGLLNLLVDCLSPAP